MALALNNLQRVDMPLNKETKTETKPNELLRHFFHTALTVIRILLYMSITDFPYQQRNNIYIFHLLVTKLGFFFCRRSNRIQITSEEIYLTNRWDSNRYYYHIIVKRSNVYEQVLDTPQRCRTKAPPLNAVSFHFQDNYFWRDVLHLCM